MKYLIDNQLPVGLVRYLNEHGLDAMHVTACGLERASDREIWNYAKDNDCVIVSKDEDFFYLSGQDASGSPVVWVRLGNCRNVALFAAFDRVLADLLEAVKSGVKIVEIR